ncbi:hypothetical protein FN846DRAFT_904014 [Sphaerosporella brunnea]|uniref:Uncharacterized protein n=1 Tax=Sphaerosporella brunnea TaxID=1250544 RepID=A0A5J5F5W4_9PEZI|nr:hypothetical protein FN846DRAFT_904014 [Sphaerosporella brunnea]
MDRNDGICKYGWCKERFAPAKMAAHMMSVHHQYRCKSEKAYVEVRYENNKAIHICDRECSVKISRNWTAQSGAEAAQLRVRENGKASDANHAEKAQMLQAAIPRNEMLDKPPDWCLLLHSDFLLKQMLDKPPDWCLLHHSDFLLKQMLDKPPDWSLLLHSDFLFKQMLDKPPDWSLLLQSYFLFKDMLDKPLDWSSPSHRRGTTCAAARMPRSQKHRRGTTESLKIESDMNCGCLS